jgi:hypothetical protein
MNDKQKHLARVTEKGQEQARARADAQCNELHLQLARMADLLAHANEQTASLRTHLTSRLENDQKATMRDINTLKLSLLRKADKDFIDELLQVTSLHALCPFVDSYPFYSYLLFRRCVNSIWNVPKN